MKYEETLSQAESMMDYLCPAFSRLEIAGSLRRKRTDKDFSEIDLIGIPDLTPPPLPRPEFGKPLPKVYKTKIDERIDCLAMERKVIVTASGPRQKKFIDLRSDIRFDLYLVFPPARWGVQFLIRTGPREFGHWIVTRRSGRAIIEGPRSVYGGALPDGYRVEHGAVWKGETKKTEKEIREDGIESIGFDTEESFLEFLGLGWIEPEDRRPRWGEMKG